MGLKASLSAAIGDIDVGKKMAINIYQWCRDMCLWTLVNGPDIKLGGPGQIIQIDESVFTHQGKVHTYTYIHTHTYTHTLIITYDT